MQDVLPSLEQWRERHEQVAVATVINTWGSAPRPIGSKLAVTASGTIAGSVSAGCVEGAVIDGCHLALKTGQPRVLSFGVADETAWEVGLACGGHIEVLVEPFAAFNGVYESLKQHLAARDVLVMISVLAGQPEYLNHKLLVLPDGKVEGDLSMLDRTDELVRAALEFLKQGLGGALTLADGTALFFEVYPPVPRLIIIGAVHIAEALVPMANLAGFDTIVIDPRSAFITSDRFPSATQLIKGWPQEILPQLALDAAAYFAVLTHDPKLDDPALRIALTSEVRYVGALGSRRTHEKRIKRLRAAGLSADQIARLHAPIGLSLGGRSPGEVAVSILAEIVQIKNAALANYRMREA